MSSFLCLVVPSIISINMYNHMLDDKLSWQEMGINYLIFMFFNHFLSVLISVLVFGARNSVISAIEFFPFFAIKYCFVSMVFAIILPFLFRLVKLNVDYRVEVNLNEKSKKKNR